MNCFPLSVVCMVTLVIKVWVLQLLSNLFASFSLHCLLLFELRRMNGRAIKITMETLIKYALNLIRTHFWMVQQMAVVVHQHIARLSQQFKAVL